MTQKSKILIIGAGPGGLMAAETLASQDFDVTLVEKSLYLDKKTCAEGITGKTVGEYPFTALSIERAFSNLKLTSYEKTKDFKRKVPFIFTINRQKLAAIQIKRAKRAGAKIFTGQEIARIQKKTAKTKSGELYHFDILIGADGNKSIVRKFLRLPTELFGAAIQYKIPTITKHCRLNLNTKRWGHEYAWSFPHANYTSVGTGYSPFENGKQRLTELKKYVKELGLSTKEAKLEAGIINCDWRGYKFGNIFLVGESSGLVSALTGEGIYNSLVMGEEVAKQIINDRAESKRIKRRLAKKRQHETLIKTYYKMPTLVSFFYKAAPWLMKLKE